MNFIDARNTINLDTTDLPQTTVGVIINHNMPETTVVENNTDDAWNEFLSSFRATHRSNNPRTHLINLLFNTDEDDATAYDPELRFAVWNADETPVYISSSFEDAQNFRRNHADKDLNVAPMGGKIECQEILSRIELLQCQDESGITRWNFREELSELEYGVVSEESALAVEGDTFCEGYTHLLEAAEGGPQLVRVLDEKFETRKEAETFIADTHKSYIAGDHTRTILLGDVEEWVFDVAADANKALNNLRVEGGSILNKRVEAPFGFKFFSCWVRTLIAKDSTHTVKVLDCDRNWEHVKLQADARDQRVVSHLHTISKCNTYHDLKAIASTIRCDSRDVQVLQESKTWDNASIRHGKVSGDWNPSKTNTFIQKSGRYPVRPVGLGLNYTRFATCMNALSLRAEELGITGFKAYNIEKKESTNTPVDGDMMDVGCPQGLFLGEETPDENYTSTLSLWEENEGAWKPSKECKERLALAGPTSMASLPWDVLSSAVDAWMSESDVIAA